MREVVGLIGHRPLRNGAEPVVAYLLGNTDEYGPMCFWDTSDMESMSGMFCHGSRGFLRDRVRRALAALSADLYWATQNVRDLSHTFANCNFNGRIGHLNTTRVTRMVRTFHSNPAFNQPLATWDVSSVKDASEMFYDARSFDQPLDAWRFGALRDARGMFRGAVSFNRPLGSWDVPKVRVMDHMFCGALSFNQPLWDVTSVDSAQRMFENTPSFNQRLDGWVLIRDLDDTAMFHNSAFEHAMTFQFHVTRRHPNEGWNAEWTRGRRMKPGRVVDAASLAAMDPAGPLVPEGWYEDNTVTFERGLPR